jgi:hypothetical protein
MPFPDSQYPSVLRVYDKRQSERLLNAAPDLLASSKELLAALRRCFFPVPHPDDRPHWDKAVACVKSLGEAIAKAEGQ